MKKKRQSFAPEEASKTWGPVEARKSPSVSPDPREITGNGENCLLALPTGLPLLLYLQLRPGMGVRLREGLPACSGT